MSTIAFNQLTQIPAGDIKLITELAALTTDSNGVSYVGRIAFTDLAAGLGAAQVFNFSVVIPTADVLTLNATPVALGLSVPANYFPNIVGDIWLGAIYGSATYATNTSLRIRSVGGSQNYVSAVNALAFSADCRIPLTKNAVTSGKGFETGADLEIYVPAGNPTAGDSDITIYGQYTLIQA